MKPHLWYPVLEIKLIVMPCDKRKPGNAKIRVLVARNVPKNGMKIKRCALLHCDIFTFVLRYLLLQYFALYPFKEKRYRSRTVCKEQDLPCNTEAQTRSVNNYECVSPCSQDGTDYAWCWVKENKQAWDWCCFLGNDFIRTGICIDNERHLLYGKYKHHTKG